MLGTCEPDRSEIRCPCGRPLQLTPTPLSRRLRNCEGCGVSAFWTASGPGPQPGSLAAGRSSARSRAYFGPHHFSLTIQGLHEGRFMANHVSSLKRARQTETRTEVNRANRTRVRSSLRALREAIAKGDAKAAQAQFRETVSTLDKGVQKGVLHSNTVSRYKSRLNARLKALSTAKA